MTLPDDIELRENITQIIYGADWRKEYENVFLPDVEAVLKLIATYRKKWEAEAYTNGFRAGAIGTLLELKSQVKAQGENK